MLGAGLLMATSNGGLWTPAQISTELWLDASDTSTLTLSGSSVSQWNDKSGNGKHAVQATAASRPTYSATGLNSKPAVFFNGSQYYMQSSVGRFSLQTRSMYIVLATANTVQSPGIFSLLPSGTASDSSSLDGMAYVGTTNQGFRAVGGLGTIQDVSIKYDLLATSSSGTNVWSEVKTIGTGTLYKNDTAVVTDSSFTEFNSVTGSDGYILGARWTSGNVGSMGINYLQEIVYSGSTHDTATRNRMFGYLAWRWGLTSLLPADHPYKSAPPYL